ncbi:MAG: glutamine amidotransferase, partial [Phycisphaerae bacterium]|nr:glutamine amidotransferase [Phycisphaerae bacterium]
LKEAARIAGANGIPIDVLPLSYAYKQEVIFKRLAAPTRARSGQTVSLRFILNSTGVSRGKLRLTLNGETMDLNPESEDLESDVVLQPGTNVKVVSVPVGSRGMHDFKAEFIPYEGQDQVIPNNISSAMTYVAGPGHVLIIEGNINKPEEGMPGQFLQKALNNSEIDSRYILASELTDNLTHLMDTDAVLLVNCDASVFSFQQQEMLTRYVKDIGGGLIMIGGNRSFGAGGWIGSPIADILPVDLDPPQKRQLPKGALGLVMHACEIPAGNLWGKRVAKAAITTLSRKDLVGILAFQWGGGNGPDSSNWVFPLAEAGDKKAALAAVDKMVMGDMPSFQGPLNDAYMALKDCEAAQKHIIIISDGDPQLPMKSLITNLNKAQITCTCVMINSGHTGNLVQQYSMIAKMTGGRFYQVKDPAKLPQIFIKEAQVIRRALIVEETFTPRIHNAFNEIIKGVGTALPPLDGYVLSGPKEGLAQIVLGSEKGDPILSTCQAGLGRCVAFTSSVDSRWAASWLAWGGFERFWEQVVRWVGKPSQDRDCEVFVDVQGREVTVNVEGVDAEGQFMQFSQIDAQIIAPDIQSTSMELIQTGPGAFKGVFQASDSGSHIINLRYRKPGETGKMHVMQTPVMVPYAPEFRDLTDNVALLYQVSEISGGRVLPEDPTQANLYDKTGVKFPETPLPIINKLMFLWLAFFLLDVAVRRIAVDFKGMARRIAKSLKRSKVKKADQTIDRLKAAREKTQEQFVRPASKPTQPTRSKTAGKRYVAGEDYEGQLPDAKIDQPHTEDRPEKPADKTVNDKKDSQEEDTSHISQLLRAKRKIDNKREDNP